MSEITHSTIKKVVKERIKFIDIARSIAILLMLEGHFIAEVYQDFDVMKDAANATGTSGNPLFDIWYFLKGFTAPMFFTVTGLVFVYLLGQNNNIKYTKNLRVTRGYRRAGQLLFWGYILQINLFHLGRTFKNEHPYIFTYHVLQSIGIGIVALLLIYGLYKIIKVIPLAVYYFVFATLIFFVYPQLKSLPEDMYLPVGAPEIVQNVIKGPRSVFPIIPWMAFTLYGGMLGALLIRFKDQVRKLHVLVLIASVGAVLNFAGYPIGQGLDVLMDKIGIHNTRLVDNAWLYGRFGQILIVLSILAAIEVYVKLKDSLFMKIGQNTLPIYVLHVIILYSGIFGYGIDKFGKHALNGFWTIVTCILFLSLFVVLIHYFDKILVEWARIKARFRHGFLRIFKKHKVKA